MLTCYVIIAWTCMHVCTQGYVHARPHFGPTRGRPDAHARGTNQKRPGITAASATRAQKHLENTSFWETKRTMPEPQQANNAQLEYTRWLAESGQTDALSLRRETAERVLTEKRMEIVEALAESEPSSVRDLARRLDRDISIVSRDLDVLFEADVIDYEQDGRAKKPVLAYENIFVEPVLFNGNTMHD